MKIRWTANSLRVRITPSELTKIIQGDAVRESLVVPGGINWQANIQPAVETSLSCEGQNVIISLAPDDCARLAAPESEGVYFQTGEGVRYCVEKDFPCAHPRAVELMEPVTETFDAPADFNRRKM